MLKLKFFLIFLTAMLLQACSEEPQKNTHAEKTSAVGKAGYQIQKDFKVYKTETCGCCGDWVTHLEEFGIQPLVENKTTLNAIKKELGIPAEMQSCHTGVDSQGYVFEGHVPAKYITQFLKNPPKNSIGLSVPGMPMGSPGMEFEDGFEPYEIYLLNKNGEHEVYAEITTYKSQF